MAQYMPNNTNDNSVNSIVPVNHDLANPIDENTDDLEQPQLPSPSTELIPASSSFDNYLAQIKAAPVLNAQQEWELAEKIREHNDLEAAQKLIFSNLRHVVSIARGYLGYGLPLPDLVQEGNVGLMKAIKRYDPIQKVKLMTFAGHWVRAEINEFVIKNWQIVKMATTKSQRKLFFKLRSQRARLGTLNAEEVTSIAQDLQVSEEDVQHMERRFAQLDTSFEGDNDASDENVANFSPANYLPDTRYSPEQAVITAQNASLEKAQLAEGLNSLDDRSRAIIEQRWLNDNKRTLKDLAQEYNVSLERIRQIENKALQTLKQHLKEHF